MLPLFKTIYKSSFKETFETIFESGMISSGESVIKIEDYFSKKFSGYALSTNNSSNAFSLFLNSLNLPLGSKICTSPFNCLASTSPIANTNHIPCWVDIDYTSGEMCPKDLELKIKNNNIQVVIYYHFSCQTENIYEISKICKKNSITLIEDCTVSLGAKINGKHIGSFGDASIFSFYPNRQINAVDGGMLLVKDKNIYDQCISLRKYGINFSDYYEANGQINPNSDIKKLGWQMTMSNLSAGLAVDQLNTYMENVAIHQKNARKYIELLKEIKGIELPAFENLEACFWTFPILSQQRDKLMEYLNSYGIMAGRVHQRNDIYSGFGASHQDLENTNRWCKNHLSLPVGWWLDKKDVIQIAELIRNFKW